MLSLDVPTRRNSTYLMLDCALKFVRAFDTLEEEDGRYKLYFFFEAYGNGKKPILVLTILIGNMSRPLWHFFCIFYEVTLRFS